MFLQNKARLKALLAGYERNSTVLIAQGLVKHRPKRLILADLKKELRKYVDLCRLSTLETHKLWVHSYKTLNQTSRLTWGKKNSTDIYGVLKEKLIYSKEFIKIKNEVANKHENVAKKDYINELLESKDTPFFLSDSHKQCAKGHLAYENKIYYDEDFRSGYGLSSEQLVQVENYIRENKLMSVQEVTGPDVWLITRPNCGHELYPVPLEDVLEGRKLRKIVVDDYKTMTGQYEYYYERSRILDALRDTLPCKELEKDYLDSLKLMRRWRMR